MRITSTKSPLIQRYRDAARGADRAHLLADGATLVEEALDSDCQVVEIAYSPSLARSARGATLQARLATTNVRLRECSDAVLARISSTDSPQGVVALVARPAHARAALLGPGTPLLLVAAGVRDPGNLGALVRTAEAAGATGLVTTGSGADPFRDKAVRGSAGSVLRLPVLAGVAAADLVEWLAAAGVALVLAHAGADRSVFDVDLRGPTALVLGGETTAVPEPLAAAAQCRACIPMRPPIDSLNVGVAGGVLLYEAWRQRR